MTPGRPTESTNPPYNLPLSFCCNVDHQSREAQVIAQSQREKRVGGIYGLLSGVRLCDGNVVGTQCRAACLSDFMVVIVCVDMNGVC